MSQSLSRLNSDASNMSAVDLVSIDPGLMATVKLMNNYEVQVALILHDRTGLSVTEGVELFKELLKIGNGTITYDVLRGCTKESAARDIVDKYCDTPLGNLRSSRLLSLLFKNIDTDRSGVITLQKWANFLSYLVIEDISYLTKLGMLRRRKYWGKPPIFVLKTKERKREMVLNSTEGCGESFSSSSPNEQDIERQFSMDSSVTKQTNLQKVLDTIEKQTSTWDSIWLADFVFYEQNHHPIFALFYAHPSNHLGRKERLAIEFCAVSWTLLFDTILDIHYPNAEVRFGMSIVIITIPVMILRELLVFFFTCPCLMGRNHVHSTVYSMYTKCMKSCGKYFGYALVIASLGVFIAGLILIVQYSPINILFWFLFSCLSYVICFFYDLCIKFNNFHVFLVLRNYFSLLRWIKLASWQHEKYQVLAALKLLESDISTARKSMECAGTCAGSYYGTSMDRASSYNAGAGANRLSFSAGQRTANRISEHLSMAELLSMEERISMDKDMIDECARAEQFLQEQQRLQAEHAQNSSSVISNPLTKSGEVAPVASAAIVAPEEQL
jgi:hypothetical protein